MHISHPKTEFGPQIQAKVLSIL